MTTLSGPAPALHRLRARRRPQRIAGLLVAAAAALAVPLCACAWAGAASAEAATGPGRWLPLGTAALALALPLAIAALWRLKQQCRRRDLAAAAAAERYGPASQAGWAFALGISGDGVWDADLEAGTTRYSRQWKQMLGYADDEVGNGADEWSRRIHPRDLDRVMAENQTCLDGHSDGFASEYRMRAKDGRWLWTLDRGKVVSRSADGRPLRMVGTHIDISQRKATQARQAAQAEVMTLVATGAALPQILLTIVRSVESMGDWQCALLLFGADGRSLCTAAAHSLPEPLVQAMQGSALADALGLRADAAAGSAPSAVVADLRVDPRWAPLRAAAAQAGLNVGWSQPIVDEAGHLLGSFVACHPRACEPDEFDRALVIEATQVASIAIARRRSEQALRDSEERLQRALDASRLALWDFDLDSGAVYLSEAWSQMLGGPPQTTTTTFDALGALVPDDDQARVAAAMGDALSGRSAGYSLEHRVRRLDGQWLWVLSQARVVERDAQGQARRAVGTNRDITERKHADATQRELESQLREAQKLQAIGTLAGGIAHDFNNIMAAILGHLALARQDLGPLHPAQPHLAQVQRAGQRARNLVKQILAFSRKRAQSLVSLSLQPMVEETAQMLRATAGPSVTMSLVLDSPPLRVMGDASGLQQVLMNLGTNAWQALEGRAGTLEFGLCETDFGDDPAGRPVGVAAGRHAQLWVSDDGCGIDEATRQRIFEPFFTTKPVGQGTGLGLAVAHGIVQAHGGAITVRTRPGHGTRFDVYLPLVDAESAFAPLEPPAEPVRGQGQHVLYVDDDEVMALLVQSLLQRLGYRATCLMDAGQAIAMVQADPGGVDLVVTDYHMPHCSGLDLARALALLRPDLPVAISSGHVGDELRAQAAAIGVRAVMQKEHTVEQLGALAHSVLRPATPG